MNIDMSKDYDVLLKEAQNEYEKLLKVSEEAKAAFIASNEDLYNAAMERYIPISKGWKQWLENNIERCGLKLVQDYSHGFPIGISAIISGRDHF